MTYKVIDVQTFPDSVDYTRRVAQCSPGAGGHCTITQVKSITTSVDVAFTATKGWVAGQIKFSLSATNSTAVLLTLNGKPLPPLGQPGTFGRMVYSHKDLR